MKKITPARVKMSAVHQNGALSSVWVLHSLSPVKKLYVHTILFQLPFLSNPIFSQFHTCYGRCRMSRGAGRTTFRLTGRLGYVGRYIWVGEKDTGDLSFFIESYAWRVFWCFRSLSIASVMWNMIQAILGSLCDARVLFNKYTYTNPVRNFFCWSSC